MKYAQESAKNLRNRLKVNRANIGCRARNSNSDNLGKNVKLKSTGEGVTRSEQQKALWFDDLWEPAMKVVTEGNIVICWFPHSIEYIDLM